MGDEAVVHVSGHVAVGVIGTAVSFFASELGSATGALVGEGVALDAVLGPVDQ